MALKFSREDNGDFRASWSGYYHATGWNRDLAVIRLDAFMREAHPDIWHNSGMKEAVSDYFRHLPHKAQIARVKPVSTPHTKERTHER